MKALQVISTDLETHPAVAAWLKLPAQPDGFAAAVPARLELLHDSDKSSVYRLPRVGRGAGAVIAKRCLHETSRVERHVYPLLQRLGRDALGYYGGVEMPDSGWLFLEDAGSECFDPRRLQHRQLAARWLARLHTATSQLGGIPGLPQRDANHYLEHLRAGREILRRGQERRVLAAADRAVLDDVHRVLDHAESRWPEVEKTSHQMPWALVHADFVKKNVRLRNGAAGEAVLLVFDWEVSGWGLPAVDLGMADLDVYWTSVRPFWPQLTPATLRRLAHVGTLMRGGTASVRWEAESLERGWLENVIGNMRLYAQRMSAALAALGWQA